VRRNSIGDYDFALSFGEGPHSVGPRRDLSFPRGWALAGDCECPRGQFARVGAGGKSQRHCRWPQRMG